MDDLQTKLALVASVGDANIRELADESGVPITTLYSFKGRDWTHKNLEVFERIVEAARRIQARKGAA